KHGYAAAGIPLLTGLSLNVNGDYQEKGGYNQIDPAKRGAIDVVSNVIQRNGYARLNYAPGANWSGFFSGHLFGRSRATGTPLSYANRDQKNLDFGFNYGEVSSGMFTVRGWDGVQKEAQRSTAIRAGARAAEDTSLTAKIPSHDWGASAQWTK